MDDEICVCGDAPHKHDAEGCLRQDCTCRGYRTRKVNVEPIPTVDVETSGRFSRKSRTATICYDFVRTSDGYTKQCKYPVNKEDGTCTNTNDEHITTT